MTADDPTARAMPEKLKSRIITLLAWCLNEQGKKKEVQEMRSAANSFKESKRLFKESRDCARQALRLNPNNWRAVVLIISVSRELKETQAAAKVLHLMAGESLFAKEASLSDSAQLRLSLLKEGAFSLAAIRPAAPTNCTKFLKAVEAVLELKPNDTNFIIMLSETIQDPLVTTTNIHKHAQYKSNTQPNI